MKNKNNYILIVLGVVIALGVLSFVSFRNPYVVKSSSLEAERFSLDEEEAVFGIRSFDSSIIAVKFIALGDIKDAEVIVPNSFFEKREAIITYNEQFNLKGFVFVPCRDTLCDETDDKESVHYSLSGNVVRVKPRSTTSTSTNRISSTQTSQDASGVVSSGSQNVNPVTVSVGEVVKPCRTGRLIQAAYGASKFLNRVSFGAVPSTKNPCVLDNTQPICPERQTRCSDGRCRTNCDEGTFCCIGAENTQTLCNNDKDDDCDGFCDIDGCIGLGGNLLGPDPDCCPDDSDACTVKTVFNGECSFDNIPNCKPCAIPKHCFDGNDNTIDACVSGKCENVVRG